MQDDVQILMVDDDEELGSLVREYLTKHGFVVSCLTDGERGAQAILTRNPDLVILDLMLPGLNGLDVCRRVRRAYTRPIMMLTASQSEADHVAGLELGADDFVIKPIDPRVLLARIRSLLRRFAPAEHEDMASVLEAGPIVLDLVARLVRCHEQEVALTNMEFDVLRMLMERSGSVVTREDLYTEISGVAYDGLDRGMDVHVSRIRRKLQGVGFDPTRLKAVRGAGYLLAYR